MPWSTFKPPQRERTRTVHTPIPEHLRRSVTYASPAGEAPQAQPKTEAMRNPALLEMARGRPCLMLIPGHTHDPQTTVSAHSNWAEHGKAGARKADEPYSAWACVQCHQWLDQGKASAEEKKAVWLAAHRRQVDHWRAIASDPSEPARYRKAAQWALNHLAGGLAP